MTNFLITLIFLMSCPLVWIIVAGLMATRLVVKSRNKSKTLTRTPIRKTRKKR